MISPTELIWLGSFPKSGNTRFRIFLTILTAAENGPTDINKLDGRCDIASSRREFEVAPPRRLRLSGPISITALREGVERLEDHMRDVF
jgi:hypothetical protein